MANLAYYANKKYFGWLARGIPRQSIESHAARY